MRSIWSLVPCDQLPSLDLCFHSLVVARAIWWEKGNLILAVGGIPGADVAQILAPGGGQERTFDTCEAGWG